MWRVRLSFGGSTVLQQTDVGTPSSSVIMIVFGLCSSCQGDFFCQTAVNKGQRKLASPFSHCRARFWFCLCKCKWMSWKKYSIQSLTSAFQLCSPVCVSAAIINGGETQPSEKCVYLYFVAELRRPIKIIISRLFWIAQWTWEEAFYTIVNMHQLKIRFWTESCWNCFKCPLQVRVFVCGNHPDVDRYSDAGIQRVVDICIPVWVCLELKPEGYMVGPQSYSQMALF